MFVQIVGAIFITVAIGALVSLTIAMFLLAVSTIDVLLGINLLNIIYKKFKKLIRRH